MVVLLPTYLPNAHFSQDEHKKPPPLSSAPHFRGSLLIRDDSTSRGSWAGSTVKVKATKLSPPTNLILSGIQLTLMGHVFAEKAVFPSLKVPTLRRNDKLGLNIWCMEEAGGGDALPFFDRLHRGFPVRCSPTLRVAYCICPACWIWRCFLRSHPRQSLRPRWRTHK